MLQQLLMHLADDDDADLPAIALLPPLPAIMAEARVRRDAKGLYVSFSCMESKTAVCQEAWLFPSARQMFFYPPINYGTRDTDVMRTAGAPQRERKLMQSKAALVACCSPC
jgi:hypothetical protein